jgi:NodT family efflux transporter outer membrane factor (OMF) lipoprotein
MCKLAGFGSRGMKNARLDLKGIIGHSVVLLNDRCSCVEWRNRMKTCSGPVWAFCSLGMVVLGGCMVGPDYKRPQTAADTATGFVNAPKGVEDVNAPKEKAKPADANIAAELDRWWMRFGDPATTDLVNEALKNNNDIKASAARVLQAQAGLAQASGALWPSVSYSMMENRSKQFFNIGSDVPGLPSGGFSFLSTTWSQGINVSYLVDFWGQLRRTEQAAWANVLGAQVGQWTVVNSTIATTIQARVNIAVLQRRLAIARANIQSRQRTLDITERRYQEGLVGPVDVRLARANLEADKTQEPALETSLAQAAYALDTLLGKRPGTSSLPETLPDLPQLEAVPVSVPAALLDRRPDVRTAEFTLMAANEQIGVSMAQLYPSLTITASYGRSSSNFEDIWEHFSETYSFAPNLVQPIFEGGRLRAGVDAAKARYAELAANYSATVLRAIQEVEVALVSEQSLQRQVEHATLQLNEARAAEELSRRRYEQGVESILTVLESERNRRLAEDQLTVLKGQIWTTRVNLHLALGGDWASQQSDKKDVARLP